MNVGRFVAGLSVCISLLALAPAAGAQPIRTGVFDPAKFPKAATQQTAFDQVQATGSTFVRLSLYWRSIAPQDRPSGFDAENPASSGYYWNWFDDQVRLAVTRGLEPIAGIAFAPRWASAGDANGIVRPEPAEFGRFARAAAIRYSGTYVPSPGAAPLPRIRFWQAWGEPNRDYFLLPQYEGGRIVSALRYRSMLYAFAAGVHGVHESNRVVAGGLAPLGKKGKPAPLAFMRQLLCVTRSEGRSCDLRVRPVPVDIWSHHPYTSGGPTHHALGRDDVAIGDLPEMRALLRKAIRLGHIRSHGPVPFWVTEFSWDTRPPDPQGLASWLHARWTSEALYRMWRSGVSLVIWYRIQDEPLSQSMAQSGFFTTQGAAKRSLKAFRFPLVAFRRPGAVYVWGRTPYSLTGRVAVEAKVGRAWRQLAVLRAGSDGVFRQTLRTRARVSAVRGRLLGAPDLTLPFSLTPVRDRFVNPFGCGGVIAC